MKAILLKLGFFVLTIMSANNLMAFTAVTNGNWTDPLTWGGVAPSGNVSNQDIIIPSGIDVNLDTDVTFSGLLNSFTVDGTLSSSGNKQLAIQSGTFSGSGDVDIQRIEFSGLLTTCTHTGDMTVHSFVNSGSLLTLALQLTVSDTLNLDGGSLTLNTGSNLMMNTNSTIVRNGGSLATSGGVFNSGGAYHVRYIGGAKTTGIEINSSNLQNTDVSMDDNTTILTMGSDLQIHGNLQLNTGILSVGANDLEILGNMNIQSGAALTTAATSNLTIQTANVLNSGLVFTAGSSIDQLSIDYTGTSGTVELDSPLSIAGELQLHNGTLSIESGATLTMSAGSQVQVMDGELEGNGGTFAGTASYDVEYIGGSTVNTGEEITGSGLNDVKVDITSGEVVMDDDVTIGGELELNSGKLNLNANNLTLNGTLNQTTPIIGNVNSDLHLNITTVGNDTITFDGSNQNLEQLVIDVTGGDIVIGSTLHIYDELTLTNGSVRLANDNLVIEQNANITGYSNTRYIMTPGTGQLDMYIPVSSPYMVFPVGTETSYSPASIQQTTGTGGKFRVKAFSGIYSGGTENSGYNSATSGSVVNRTWLVESDMTTFNLNLKLGWMATSEVNGFDRTNAFISHYTSGSWDTYAASSAVAGANSTYEISRMGVTSLSPFAVAEENTELLVEETALSDLNLYPNPCTNELNISYTNANGDQYTCQVTDIAGRKYEVVSTAANQLDVSRLSQGTYLLKMTNVETNKVSIRQFIKK
nr:T9SS type A sorting domain-containing protein [uncultured Fluviicola sp.]